MKLHRGSVLRRTIVVVLALVVTSCDTQHRPADTIVLPIPTNVVPKVEINIEESDPNLVASPLDMGTDSVEMLDCVQCHSAFATFPIVHGALLERGCVACHEATEARHPIPEAREFRLRVEGAELCLECHAEIGQGVSRHAPIDDEKGCLSCHRPHVSEHPKLLDHHQVRLNCQRCHEPRLVTRPHEPVLAGECTACHDPHGSNHPSLAKLDPKRDLCISCHVEFLAVATAPGTHFPVRDDCAACHEPHGGDYPALLRDTVTEVCVSCHSAQADVLQLSTRHAPIEDCTLCHDPHGDEPHHLLRRPVTGLCLGCHDAVLSGESGRTVHAPIESERGCVSCHDAHGTRHAGLLAAPGGESCFQCHEALQRETAASSHVHDPVARGECTVCHDPHESKSPGLLRAAYPAVIKKPYSRDEYGLCFSCHDAALVEEPTTESSTKFRDGTRNLHHLHVVEKGRTCRACHEVHSGAGASLVRSELPYGQSGWVLPIEFVSEERGGGCRLSCHVERKYRR